MPVVDADTHVIENEAVWSYMTKAESAWRPVPVAGDGPQGGERKFWLVEGRQLIRGGAKDTPEMTAAMRDLSDLPARLRHMDRLGVDIQVVYPTFFLAAVTRKPEVELALVRSYNRFMADMWSQEPTRIRWVVVPPLLDMDATMQELEFGKRNGAVGVFIRGMEGDRYLKDPYFEPLWSKAEELDLAICVHAGNGNVDLNDIQARNFFDMLVLPIVSAFQQLLVGGVPLRHPTLRYGFFEAGSNWVPFLIQQTRKQQEIFGRTLMDDPVRAGNMFISCESDDDLAYIIQFTGDRNLVIGSDYGHTDTAAEVEALMNLKKRGSVDAAVIDRILDDNAVTFYALT